MVEYTYIEEQKDMTSTTKKTVQGFTDDEKAAMRERAQELSSNNTDGERMVLEKISQMSEPDRSMAKRIHEIVHAVAPNLVPRTWYGMPAYAKDGKVICFFQSAQKFKSRYATLGFSDVASLDDGAMWPTTFALTKLTSDEEAKITALIKKAIN